MKKTKKRVKTFLILLNILLSTLLIISINSTSDEIKWWDENWSYNMKISIPFYTSNNDAKHQPIDMKIFFENKCFAKNELDHSIRVCYIKDDEWQEIESQIYNLEYDENQYINGCSIVFLIPKDADGTEEYYIYYDDSEKTSPNYVDHITIEESYYHYEPIPGYPFNSYYYRIFDDGYINYIVSKEGQLMGYDTSQHVMKMKEKTQLVKPKNQELFAAFDFRYTYDEGVFSYSSTSQKLVSSEILVDGNLMTEIILKSRSRRDDLETNAIYRYYHCPSDDKRIHVHVHHQTLEEIDVYQNPPPTNTDGIYASMQMGGIKSRSIEELNIGKILNFMNINDEKTGITEYKLDPDPEYIPNKPDIRVLRYQDDVDLDSDPWVTFNEGENGDFHSLIFSSNEVLKNGLGERDGIQVNSFQMDFPHFPGLENNLATVQMGRNSYEPGSEHDLKIPKGFIVEFDAEFFSSKNSNIDEIQNEVEIFKKLVNIKDYFLDDKNVDEEKIETYPLEVSVHLAKSFPFGSALSAVSGLNFAYVSAELYKDGELISIKSASRIPMNAIDDITNMNLLQKTVAMMRTLDLRNISLFKKVKFENLEPGRYIIKIIKEKSFLNKNQKYVGYKIIDLNSDTKTNIICRPEGKINIILTDQNDEKISNAEIILEKEGEEIVNIKTDKEGYAEIKAPIITDSYNLKVRYNNLIFHEQKIKLTLLKKIFLKTENIEINRFNLDINIFDKWDLPISDINLNPYLINNDLDENNKITPEETNDNSYYFSDLKNGKYQIYMKYKSFEYADEINIDRDENYDIVFPAIFNVEIKTLDSRGNNLLENKIILSRGNKKTNFDVKDSVTSFFVPPGFYKLQIYDNDDLIASRNIDVYNKKAFTVVTVKEPIYPMIAFTIFVILVISSIVLSYVRKNKLFFILTTPISLSILSLFYSWWSIEGSSNVVKTSSNMYILPANLISFTEKSVFLFGEKAYIPDIFIMVLYLIPIATIIGSILFIASIYLKKKEKKLLNLITIAFSLILLIGSIGLFIYGMSTLNELGIGSFIGEGPLDISIPGEKYYTVNSNWGPSVGFYLYIITIIWVIITQFYYNKKNKWEITK